MEPLPGATVELEGNEPSSRPVQSIGVEGGMREEVAEEEAAFGILSG